MSSARPMPTTMTWPPRRVARHAARIVAARPTHSKAWSAPRPAVRIAEHDPRQQGWRHLRQAAHSPFQDPVRGSSVSPSDRFPMVGENHDAPTFRNLPQNLAERRVRGRVKPRPRLVKHKQPRRPQQRLGKRDFLRIPLGQRPNRRPHPAHELEPLEDLEPPARGRRTAGSFEATAARCSSGPSRATVELVSVSPYALTNPVSGKAVITASTRSGPAREPP